MNGIDTQEWNPETDRHLPEDVRYSASTVTLGKAAAKALFQERYGLSIVADIPLVGMIGRLAPQKGVDVVLAALPALLAPNNATAGSQVPGQQQSSHQLAILGSGEIHGFDAAASEVCVAESACMFQQLKRVHCS